MKKILIIYPIAHQKALVDSIKDNVCGSDLVIDSFDISSWKLYSRDVNLRYSWYGKILMYESGIPVFSTFVSKLLTLVHLLFDQLILQHLFDKYDIIDFHYYERIYFPLIKMALKKGKGIKLNHWGSDLLRAPIKIKNQLKSVYDYCDIIQVATKNMRNAVISISPIISNKVKVLHFGNSVLSRNYLLFENEINTDFIGKNIGNKIVLTCGYNGSSGQQHLKMISAINRLPNEIKNQLFIIVPMTYGAALSYIDSIEKAVAGNNYDYSIITNRLSDKQLFDLRRITDIAFNIQITDAFSGSLQEHILCGSILLVGDWLNYDIMKEAGIYYITTSDKSLYDNLLSTIEHLQDIKLKCSHNKELIYNLCSWKCLAPVWHNVYDSIIKK